MKYVATRTFVDLQDNHHRYVAGDDYPRSGATPSDSRIKELLSRDNRLGVAVIKEVPEEVSPLAGNELKTPSADETAPKTTKAKKKAKKG